jgi:hypothetical protein
VCRASVPEAPVDEDCDTYGFEQDVCFSPEFGYRPSVDSEPMAESVECRPKGQFGSSLPLGLSGEPSAHSR